MKERFSWNVSDSFDFELSWVFLVTFEYFFLIKVPLSMQVEDRFEYARRFIRAGTKMLQRAQHVSAESRLQFFRRANLLYGKADEQIFRARESERSGFTREQRFYFHFLKSNFRFLQKCKT